MVVCSYLCFRCLLGFVFAQGLFLFAWNLDLCLLRGYFCLLGFVFAQRLFLFALICVCSGVIFVCLDFVCSGVIFVCSVFLLLLRGYFVFAQGLFCVYNVCCFSFFLVYVVL